MNQSFPQFLDLSLIFFILYTQTLENYPIFCYLISSQYDIKLIHNEMSY